MDSSSDDTVIKPPKKAASNPPPPPKKKENKSKHPLHKDKKKKVPSKSSKVAASSTAEKMDTAPSKKKKVPSKSDSSSSDDSIECIPGRRPKKAASKPSKPNTGEDAAATEKKAKKRNASTKKKASSSTTTQTKKKQKSMAAAVESDDYSSDEYDSDEDKKESSRVVVQPTTLSSVEDIGDEVNGKLKLRIKTLRGELHYFTVNPTDDNTKIRQLYWDSHPEWGNGPPHKAINFISDRTHHFLEEGRPLSDFGAVHGSTLLLVIGSSMRFTGGWHGPYGNTNPPRPHDNIYRVSDWFNPVPHAPPAAAAGPPAHQAAAAAPSDDDSVTDVTAAANAPDEEEPEPQTAQIPGFLEVHAVVNTPGGNTTTSGNSIIHDGSKGATYIAWADTPCEFMEVMDVEESHLPSSNDRCDLSFRLNGVKIGQAEDLRRAISKLIKFRRFHPHVFLRGVILLHNENPRVLERAQHICNSLKRGQTFGEWFGQYTQLDRFQFIELGESLNGTTLIYFSTISFPRCGFDEDTVFKNETKGLIYRIFPLWSDRDKEILTSCINNHGGLWAFYPFRYDMTRVSFLHYCTVLLYAVKIGRWSAGKTNSVEEHLSKGILYANGFISEFCYTTMDSDATEQDERNMHIELNNFRLHVAGEHFLSPPLVVQMSQQTADLFNDPVATKSRAFPYIRETSLNLHEYVRKNYMAFPILWECFKEGAIVLNKKDNRKGTRRRKWEIVTQGEKLMSRLPADLIDVVKLHQEEDMFGTKAKNICDIATTVLEQDIYNARNDANIIVKTATREFRRPSLSDARRDFIDVFGQDCYNRVIKRE
ncbi:hypothetical protein ACHAWT_000316 [Skeletonema menzelii]